MLVFIWCCVCVHIMNIIYVDCNYQANVYIYCKPDNCCLLLLTALRQKQTCTAVIYINKTVTLQMLKLLLVMKIT